MIAALLGRLLIGLCVFTLAAAYVLTLAAIYPAGVP